MDSIALPGTDSKERAGQTAIFRNAQFSKKLLCDSSDGVTTLYENFLSGLSKNPNGNCYGYRSKETKAQSYVWQSFQQIHKRLIDFGSGLLHLQKQIQGKQSFGHWNLGIYSVNRIEWGISEQACYAYSLSVVALYDTLGADTVQYIINHADLNIVVCSVDKISLILKVASKCPKLRYIISMDPLETSSTSQLLFDWASDKNIQLLDFTKVEALGQKFPVNPIAPKPQDICTICYTSGTTGDPKGALSTHRNYVSVVTSLQSLDFHLDKTDVLISYLPLAHCFERAAELALLRVGGSIGYFRGDVLLLVEDIAVLKPTCFPSVPRLFNRIYDKIIAETLNASGIRGHLFRYAYSVKQQNMKNGGGLKHSLWDSLLFSKVAAILGGRLKWMMCGSAPVSPIILEFLRIMFSCDVVEGYGQTENAAGSCVTLPSDYR